MSEARHTKRLEAALDLTGRIERKLGESCMPSVCPAEDLKHRLNVALGILRPELAALLEAVRLLRCTRRTARGSCFRPSVRARLNDDAPLRLLGHPRLLDPSDSHAPAASPFAEPLEWVAVP